MTIPDEIRAGLATALFTFAFTASLAVAGWANDVAEWASSDGTTAFPSGSALAKVVAAAALSAGAGLLNVVGRWAQSKLGFGKVPTYVEPG